MRQRAPIAAKQHKGTGAAGQIGLVHQRVQRGQETLLDGILSGIRRETVVGRCRQGHRFEHCQRDPRDLLVEPAIEVGMDGIAQQGKHLRNTHESSRCARPREAEQRSQRLGIGAGVESAYELEQLLVEARRHCQGSLRAEHKQERVRRALQDLQGAQRSGGLHLGGALHALVAVGDSIPRRIQRAQGELQEPPVQSDVLR
mmetsp:Transcript_1550/g.6764  ORF Transcript_1550/g.6764 Transcript_1550/m.6764 type:complete len:201 (+) Transcript_1550:1255-1857(+)